MSRKHLVPVVKYRKLKNGCWEWRGVRTAGVYGEVRVNGKGVRAHRYMWEQANGPIPSGLWVLHRCDNPPCVNPAHLFLGTAKDNLLDAIQKGRHRGSPLRYMTQAQKTAMRDRVNESIHRSEKMRRHWVKFGKASAAFNRTQRGIPKTESHRLALRKAWAERRRKWPVYPHRPQETGK